MPSRNDLELLAPAGGPEQLHAAIHFGADAVYLAGRRWGMRGRADNFSDEELEEAVAYAHARDVTVHLALNTLMYDDDLADLSAYLRRIEAVGVDALIVADLGAMALARRCAPHVALHVSTQASVTNAACALEYARLGASRIVLAREMSMGQIALLHRTVGDAVELEAFAHGAMCMAVSGRCLLSATMVGTARSANRGQCTQPCRWTWTLREESRPNQAFGLDVDDSGSYLLSANDLCMIEHLDALAEAGVRSAKIEGRNKGAYYVGATTNAYRHVIDGDDPAHWLGELEATSHRPYSTGFYFGDPTQNPGRVEYSQDRMLVAVVSSCAPADEGFLVEAICRNRANAGDELVVLSPGRDVRRMALHDLELWDEELGSWQPSPDMRANMRRYRLRAPFPLGGEDMLCRQVRAL